MTYLEQLKTYLKENDCSIISITAIKNHNIKDIEEAAKLILEFIQAPTVLDPELF